MKLRLYIDSPHLRLHRCQAVVLDGDRLAWTLAPKGQYDVMEAYERAPHRELMGADTDGALKVFVRRWGPLRSPDLGADSLTCLDPHSTS